MSNETVPPPQTDDYWGLPGLLQGVRWVQHLLSIVAEVLILLSFAMSGMDVSLGGVMASVPILKVLWAGMFALGVDTAFALSWVRVRQCLFQHRWLSFLWNLGLAVGMSVVIFEPLAIQLIQQTLNVDFAQAVASLGINIVLLTYARAAVAVLLGAILAMTNVEGKHLEQAVGPKRRLILFERLLDRVAPVVSEELAAVAVREETPLDIAEQPTEKMAVVPKQLSPPVAPPADQPDTTPEERAARVQELDLSGQTPAERISRIVALFPEVSDRELGKLSGVSAATAKTIRLCVQPKRVLFGIATRSFRKLEQK